MKGSFRDYIGRAGKALFTVFMALFIYYAVQIAYSTVYALLLTLWNPSATEEHLTQLLMEGATMLSLVSGCVTLVIYFLLPPLQRLSPIQSFHFRRIPIRSLPLMLLFGLFGAYSLNVVLPLIPFPEWAWEVYEEQVSDILGEFTPLTFVTVVILAPILEELLFRSIAVGQLGTMMPKWIAVLLTSALFGVAHGNLIQGTYAFLLGTLLGFIFLRYRSVYAGILFHAGFNASSYLLTLLPEEYYAIIFLFSLLLFVSAFVLFFADTYFIKKKEKKKAAEAALAAELAAIEEAVASGDAVIEESY